MVVSLPCAPRARKIYRELRNLGFAPHFAVEVTAAIDGASSELVRWALVQRVLREDPEGARDWLRARGY